MTAHDTYLCWEQLEVLAETLTPTERSALLRAGRGAEWLDKHEPGWHERVDLQLFDMRVCAWCIVGQVMGSYTQGLWDLGLTSEDAPDYGFDQAAGVDPIAIAADYAALREAWTTLILARCAGRAL